MAAFLKVHVEELFAKKLFLVFEHLRHEYSCFYTTYMSLLQESGRTFSLIKMV